LGYGDRSRIHDFRQPVGSYWPCYGPFEPTEIPLVSLGPVAAAAASRAGAALMPERGLRLRSSAQTYHRPRLRGSYPPARERAAGEESRPESPVSGYRTHSCLAQRLPPPAQPLGQKARTLFRQCFSNTRARIICRAAALNAARVLFQPVLD